MNPPKTPPIPTSSHLHRACEGVEVIRQGEITRMRDFGGGFVAEALRVLRNGANQEWLVLGDQISELENEVSRETLHRIHDGSIEFMNLDISL
ncbi:hypothetical protein Droror1_Dr00028211, partial [Drosera rotundifolia]